MYVIHVLASVSDQAAGTTHAVTGLTAALAESGCRASIQTVSGWNAHPQQAPTPEACEFAIAHKQDFSGAPLLARLCVSGAMRRALRSESVSADVLHSHGLWLMPNLYAAEAARESHTPLIVSPHGMLSPVALRFSRIKKAVSWRMSHRRALQSAACLHAASEQEYQDIRGAGLRNPVAVVRFGVDLPAADPAPPTPHSTRGMLSLGRLHPKKGLDRLVDAWARLESDHPDWVLLIRGPDESGTAARLKALAAKHRLRRIKIEGPVFGDDKRKAYSEAELFVLPTLDDNFALAAAEALAARTPVIATKGAPWEGLETERCGWWADHGVEALTAAMAQAMTLPSQELQSMGARGRAWMAREFSWDLSARRMLDVYRWLVGEQDAPECVKFD